MKRKGLLLLAAALALMIALTGCAPKDAGLAILIGLDKTELVQGELPCRSYYEGETLMVPLCEVAQALGYSAEWDAATKTAVIDDGYIQKATLTVGSTTAVFEGKLKMLNMSREAELTVKPAVVEGVLYVPADFFTEFLNDVEYGEGIVTIAPSMNYTDYVKAFFG